MASQGLSPAYQAVLRELQSEFLTLLPERVSELRNALKLVETDLAARTTLRRVGHRIAGTAATVSLKDVGSVGRAIEEFVAAREGVEGAWSHDEVARVAGAVALLDEWAAEALSAHEPRAEPLLQDPRFLALLPDEATP